MFTFFLFMAATAIALAGSALAFRATGVGPSGVNMKYDPNLAGRSSEVRSEPLNGPPTSARRHIVAPRYGFGKTQKTRDDNEPTNNDWSEYDGDILIGRIQKQPRGPVRDK